MQRQLFRGLLWVLLWFPLSSDWVGLVPHWRANGLIFSLAVNLSLAFCMGNDLTAIANSPQPMAHILANSLGQKGTLTLWSMIVLAQ